MRSQHDHWPFVAKEALAAANVERHHHAVADFELLIALPDLDHFAHELMAEDVALFHGRDVAVIEMQVGAADRGGGDLDDGVPRLLDDADREPYRPARRSARGTPKLSWSASFFESSLEPNAASCVPRGAAKSPQFLFLPYDQRLSTIPYRARFSGLDCGTSGQRPVSLSVW